MNEDHPLSEYLILDIFNNAQNIQNYIDSQARKHSMSFYDEKWTQTVYIDLNQFTGELQVCVELSISKRKVLLKFIENPQYEIGFECIFEKVWTFNVIDIKTRKLL